MSKAVDRTRPRIGEIYNMHFDGTGSEQSGWRPGLVFQNNKGNDHSPNIIVLPLTSSLKKLGMPTHVLLKSEDTGLRRDSIVLCENPQRMSKEKVGTYITTLSDSYMKKVAEGFLLASAGISFLDVTSLIRIWQRSVKLNMAA